MKLAFYYTRLLGYSPITVSVLAFCSVVIIYLRFSTLVTAYTV